jgi:hypothetical protein
MRLPAHLDNRALWSSPNPPNPPLPLVPQGAAWRGAGRRAPGPWLLLGGLGEATLATPHADATHLGRCWIRRGNGRSRRRGRIAGSRQIW